MSSIIQGISPGDATDRTEKPLQNDGLDTKPPYAPATDAPEVNPEKPSDVEQQKTHDGILKFSRVGWKRLTILLIVEAVASVPHPISIHKIPPPPTFY